VHFVDACEIMKNDDKTLKKATKNALGKSRLHIRNVPCNGRSSPRINI